MRTIKTGYSCFVENPPGLWHYRNMARCSQKRAIEDALRFRPADGHSLFWWIGIPAALLKRDTPETLGCRWDLSRLAYYRGNGDLLTVLKRQGVDVAAILSVESSPTQHLGWNTLPALQALQYSQARSA